MSNSLRPRVDCSLPGFVHAENTGSGLPFPSQGDLPNPGIEPRSPALQAHALSSEPPGKPSHMIIQSHMISTVLFTRNEYCFQLPQGTYSILREMQMLFCSVTMPCSTLQPHGLWLPGSSVHGIFQARVPEWIVISFSRGSSQPRDRTKVSRIAVRCFTL